MEMSKVEPPSRAAGPPQNRRERMRRRKNGWVRKGKGAPREK